MGVRRNREVYRAGLGIETTANTYKSPTVMLMCDKIGLSPNITDTDLNPMTGIPGDSYTIREKAEPGGSLESWAWPEAGLEQLLKMVFGAASSTRNIPSTGVSYTHEFSQDRNVMLSASIIRLAQALTAKEPQAYVGCMLKKLTFGFNGPGPIQMTAEFDASNLDLSQSAPSLTKTVAAPFVWGDFQAKLDNSHSGKVTKATIVIDLATDPMYGDDNSLSPGIKTYTDFKVSGRLEFPYEDWDELKNYIGGSTSATTIGRIIKNRTLQLTCTGANIETTYNYLFDFKMPKINFKSLDNDKDNDKTEMYGFDWVAQYYDGSDTGLGTNKIASATVVSKLATIT